MKKISLSSIINAIMFLYIISLYIFTYRENFNIISNILAFILVLLIWVNLLIVRKGIVFNKYLLLHLIFILTCIGSVFFAIDQGTAISKIRTLVLILLVMISLVNYLDSFNKLKKFMIYFVYAGFIASIYILVTSDFSQITRYGSELGNVNAIGMIIGISATFCFCLMLEDKKYRYSLLLLVMLPIILLTGSRKAMFFIVMNTILILYFKYRTGVKSKLKFFMIGTIIILVSSYLIFNIPIFYQIIGRRIESLIVFVFGGTANERSVYTRVYMIETGLKMFKERPLTGYGINNYRFLFSGVSGGRETYSHNNIIELMVGTGLIGVVLFYLSHFVIVKGLLKVSNTSNNKAICYAFLAIIISYTILSVGLVYYDSKHFSFLLAIASIIVRIDKNEEFKKESIMEK